jgi:hypothetical protein
MLLAPNDVSNKQEYELRQAGIEKRLENLQEPDEAAVKRPQKPRKTMYETEEEYARRLAIWNQQKPPETEVKPKSNSMTQLLQK